MGLPEMLTVTHIVHQDGPGSNSRRCDKGGLPCPKSTGNLMEGPLQKIRASQGFRFHFYVDLEGCICRSEAGDCCGAMRRDIETATEVPKKPNLVAWPRAVCTLRL